MDKTTMTVKELQETMNIGRVKAYELCSSAGFPAIRIGRKVLISCAGLRRWIAEKESENSGQGEKAV